MPPPFPRKKLPSFRARRGLCPECREWHGLTADGLLRRHRVFRYTPVCDGSFMKPLSIEDKKEES